MKKVKVSPSFIKGRVSIPGDKSISHRALMFGSIAEGESVIENLLEGHDCIATVQVMRALGVHIALNDGLWIIKGTGTLSEPSSPLDCKNSGTTIRLMSGLLSAMPFMSILDGTDQIKTRPMDRVIKPLLALGAKIYGRAENRLAPLVILPSEITGGDCDLVVKSAQVKSAMLLAGLFAKNSVSIKGVGVTRDHTERMLSFMGADISCEQDRVSIKPLKKPLSPLKFRVPGDISSAAFLLVAASVISPEGVTLEDVGVNPTRTGIIDALKQMGAEVILSNQKMVANEPVADLFIKSCELKAAHFSGDHIVRMIDEVPVLALLCTQANGKTVISDAEELKVKESNRIKKTVEILQSLGAKIKETDDGMIIEGPTKLMGGEISSFGDHRLALMGAIAGLMSKDPVVISNAEVTDDSYPGFFEDLKKLGANIFHGLNQ
jgi:3-phosphoshikimate 1-carboxyvinyltransferase